MRGHENNVRSLFAGREEAAMRQTEGLRVHVESTVEHSEERISSLLEHSTDMNSTLSEVNENVSHLLTMMAKIYNGIEEDRRQQEQGNAAAAAAAAVATNEQQQLKVSQMTRNIDRRGSIVPPTPPRSKVARSKLPDNINDVDGEEKVDLLNANLLATTATTTTTAPTATTTTTTTTDENLIETQSAKSVQEKQSNSEPITNEQSNDDSSTVGGDGDIEISASEEDQWICVPGENGDNFYFNTLNKELWKGPGVPKNIIEAPSVDSPIIPRR
jgi:hypothetical protein